jgi:hypothetical protein
MGIYLGDDTYFGSNYRVNIIPQDSNKYNPKKPSESKVYYIDGMYTSSEFSVRGGNSYQSQIDLASGLVGLVDTAKQKASQFVSAKGAAQGVGISATPTSMTDLVWTGSDAPTFTVNLVFVCTKSSEPSQSVVAKVNKIMKYLYPQEGSLTIASKKITGLTSPAGYNPETGKGLIRLQIGSWFDATGLVIESAQFDYSKEYNQKGEPIYALGQVVLKPHRAITYDQYIKYFKNVGK